jgi:hypothetical protein
MREGSKLLSACEQASRSRNMPSPPHPPSITHSTSYNFESTASILWNSLSEQSLHASSLSGNFQSILCNL